MIAPLDTCSFFTYLKATDDHASSEESRMGILGLIKKTEQQMSFVESTSCCKARNPQNNGICERFHKAALDQFYRIASRKKIFGSVEGLQTNPEEGKRCQGRTPIETFMDGIKVATEVDLSKQEKQAA